MNRTYPLSVLWLAAFCGLGVVSSAALMERQMTVSDLPLTNIVNAY